MDGIQGIHLGYTLSLYFSRLIFAYLCHFHSAWMYVQEWCNAYRRTTSILEIVCMILRTSQSIGDILLILDLNQYYRIHLAEPEVGNEVAMLIVEIADTRASKSLPKGRKFFVQAKPYTIQNL